jgi:1-acyl-sn-glycerol-3-phosphate acyltransferase
MRPASLLRLAWRLPAVLIWILAGLLTLMLVYRFFSNQQRATIKKNWSGVLLMLCGLRTHVIFSAHQQSVPRQALIALNHVSWLDIFVVNHVVPATFIAKSEIRSWPILGWLVAGAGTIFIERGSRHAVRRVNHEIKRRLEQEEHVAFFPEGSTSDGFSLLPFHSSLFAAALTDDDQAYLTLPVQPAVLRYFEKDVRSARCAYIDHQTLVHSVVQILSTPGLSVELEFLPVIDSLAPPLTRHALAAQTEDQIRCAL